MRRIKVLHICDKFGLRGSTIHGVSRLLTWWFPRYDRTSFEVKLYGVKTPDNASQSLEDEGLSISFMGKPRLSPSILPAFMRVIREEKPDVLHLHGWIASNFGRIAGRLSGVPSIMHEHGVDPAFPSSQRFADLVLSSLTDTAVAVSQSVQKFLVEQRYVDSGKIRLVYNGAPLDQFRVADPALIASARKDLGIPDGAKIVGSIGRLDTQKGLIFLINAIPEIVKNVPNARFLVVGDGPKKAELEETAKKLGLSEIVCFTGHRSDIATIQSMLDVQAFPSLWEGTPLTVFEAMAMGRAIVSTDVDGLGEILVDGSSALIVPPSNTQSLAKGITRVLTDDALRNRLSSGAKERSADFDIQHTVDDLESIYEELAANGRNSRR